MERHEEATDPIAARKFNVPALAKMHGRIRLDVGGSPAAMLRIDDGVIELGSGDHAAEADAIVLFEEREDIERILRGELSPIVAALQGRLAIDGNVELGTRVILELNARAASTESSAPAPTEDRP